MLRGAKKVRFKDRISKNYLPGNTILAPSNTELNIDFPKASFINPTQCSALTIDNTFVNNVVNELNEYFNKGTLIENGAFYISSVSEIKKTKNRISGDIATYKMPEFTYIEIDEPEDWIVAESLMKKFILKDKTPDFSKIKIFLSDVDGVLTDAGMYYTENGDEFKKFCTYDGMGFQLLQKSGVKVGILTTEDRDLNRRRAKKLGLDFDFHGAKDKLQVVKDLCEKENISLDEIAYIGDDLNCFELLSNAGVSACPMNAVSKIKSIPNIIQLNRRGGDGVVREFIELLLS